MTSSRRLVMAVLAILALGCTATTNTTLPSPSGAAAAPPTLVHPSSLPLGRSSPPGQATPAGQPTPSGSRSGPSPSGGVQSPSASGSTSGSPSGSASPTPFTIADWQPWPAKDPGAPSVVVDRGPNLPLVALTIDDGLDPTACQEEFEWLQANSIPATFFPTWVGVAKDHDLWRQIAAAGYPIGDHTLTHIDIGRHTTPVHTITHQLADARTRIEKIIGHPLIPVWRPPYGDYSKRSLEVAGQLGFHTMVEWSMTSGDSGPRSKPEGMIQRAIAGGPGTILLTHCNDQVSADILPAIVQGYLDKGFTFVTVPDMLRPYGLGG